MPPPRPLTHATRPARECTGNCSALIVCACGEPQARARALMSARLNSSSSGRPCRCKSIAQFESRAAPMQRRPVHLRVHMCPRARLPGGHDRPHWRTRRYVWLWPRLCEYSTGAGLSERATRQIVAGSIFSTSPGGRRPQKLRMRRVFTQPRLTAVFRAAANEQPTPTSSGCLQRDDQRVASN
jgi:hypothetical protein